MVHVTVVFGAGNLSLVSINHYGKHDLHEIGSWCNSNEKKRWNKTAEGDKTYRAIHRSWIFRLAYLWEKVSDEKLWRSYSPLGNWGGGCGLYLQLIISYSLLLIVVLSIFKLVSGSPIVFYPHAVRAFHVN